MTTAVEVITTKRDGEQLGDDQVQWVLEAYLRGEVAPEQMSALLMAIVWRGLSPRELSAWTSAMVASGSRMDLSGTGRPVVDKHSSGGVGDKVSLVVAPLVACLGVAVPKLSGRGLGHTGGTLDKLESILGWRGDLSTAQFLEQLRSVGAVIASAGADLAPADKQLYALRDVTATVESIPLIASSIMSKKIAGGADDLREVCLAVASEMLALGGVPQDPAAALADGRALEVWRRMVAAQGGDPDATLPRAPHVEVVVAPRSGHLVRLDALAVGTAAWRLGAGRARKEDSVDPAAGVVLGASLGDRVEAGQPLLTLHASSPDRLADGRAALEGSYDIADEPRPLAALVLEKVG